VCSTIATNITSSIVDSYAVDIGIAEFKRITRQKYEDPGDKEQQSLAPREKPWKFKDHGHNWKL
jgi:hypothetical protein